MTPTEQDKELRDWLVEHTALIEETGGAVWRELEVETFMCHLRELITADRKRVALEARIDELENHGNWANERAWRKKRISELKEQYESIK